jgi:hypothetical protein
MPFSDDQGEQPPSLDPDEKLRDAVSDCKRSFSMPAIGNSFMSEVLQSLF